MDQQEKELLERNLESDAELKSLWEEHLLLNRQSDQLSEKRVLTTAEQQTLKQLKKQKLDCKTKLADKLDELKKAGK